MINLDATFFSNSLDYTGIGIAITDPSLEDNPIIFINQGFTDITQYHLEEVMGRNCRFLQGEDTNKDEVAKIKRTMSRFESYKTEILNYKKDGTPFWNELSIDPAKNNKDDKTYFVGVQKDITKRKTIELAHLETIKEYHHLPCPIIPLLHDIGVMPIVGLVTKGRISNLIEATKRSIHDHTIKTLAVDVSCINTVNEATFEALLDLHDHLHSVGTEMVVTGFAEHQLVAPLDLPTFLSSKLNRAASTQELLLKFDKNKWS
ncbi:PAS domain-containing protein [Shouchella hunanensis]|uniref:PAS domain-containing protein n=1 Tax=Shouchella hunanensis TaxID=766894 RepID=A0ABY7W6M2_9BACI|nr:PAS domain-containing protein [Shouchella hunanensis]WDF03269.1 PAS domain-containing protein [Shouchella hunanensis]